jgi:tetratricopeptide (TPR) repeat protein
MALDIDALLAADAQGAKRTVKDACVGRHLPNLQHAESNDRKLGELIRKAVNLAEEDPPGAARYALKAVNLEPEHPIANQAMGMALERLGRLSQAIEFYERAWRFNPADPNIYYNLGIVAWKLDMLDAAERFYRIALDMQPGSTEAIVNLAGVLRDQGRTADAVEILRASIYAAPENPLYWNSLGSVLLDGGDPEQAKTFYEETLRLTPDFARGWHNLGFAQLLIGDVEGSLASSERALINPEGATDEAEMRHGRAMAFLASGRLEEGWRDHGVRLEHAYSHATHFVAHKPRWNADTPIAGKHLLLVAEQGVGDEVLFLNVVPDLVEELGPEGRLTVACDGRLAPLVERSFPTVRAGGHGTVRKEGLTFRGAPLADWNEVDLWTPMGTPPERYRRSIDAFPDTPYLKPDPDRVAAYQAALAELPPGPKVGLCWKSKLMSAKRTKFFSPFEDWQHVLRTPGAVFVNLQYGDVSQEIPLAEKDYGVTIHQIPGLDLMGDLEGVAALGAALDLAIGPLNASTNLAGAAGCPVWFVTLKTSWVLLSTDRAPWYPRSRAFCPSRYGEWTSVMKQVGGELADFAAARQAA